MTTAPAEPAQPRLSPFVFPPDTTFRFALLVVAVLGANLYIWNWLWLSFGADRGEVRDDYLRCTSIRPALDISGVDPATYDRVSRAFSECINDINRPLAWWMVGGTVLLLVVATLISLLFPTWISRRRRLRPLPREDAPAVAEELDALSAEAGLDEKPRWVWNPLDPSPTGLAFGRPGNHAVALMGGLVTRQIADPPAFRAVVRHELAHLRNRDVGLTYATLSLWYAFLLVGALPFAVVAVNEGIDTVLALGWRLLALTALVYLTRNSVLRAREVFADVRASVPDGPHGALRRILGALPSGSGSAWRRLWRVHPDPQVRLAAIDDTRRLFSLGVLVAFGTGVFATIAYDSLVTFVGFFVRDPLSIRLLAAIPAAPLVMGVVGIGIWRGSWNALADGGRPRPPTWALALALGAGFVVGPQLALERAVRLEGDSTLLETAFGSGAIWIALLALTLVLVLAWVGGTAETWIRARAGAERPARTTLLGLLLASGFLAVVVAVFTYARDTRSEIGRHVAVEHAVAADVASVGPKWLWDGVFNLWVLSLLEQPVIVLALIVIWLFPLAAWLRRRTQSTDAPWAFLDPGGRLRIPPLGRVSLEPWRVGALAGVAALCALVVLRIGLRLGFSAEEIEEPGFGPAFSYWQYLIAFTAQAVAAMVVAARVRELPLVGALAAAFTAGVVATAGIVLLPSLGSCIDPIALRPSACSWYVTRSNVWFNFRLVIAEGALVALAGGAVVLGVRALLGRRRVPQASAVRPS